MSQLHHASRRKHQKRGAKSASLNLVSLMDIFTILVFFLMVNSSEVEVLQTTSDIKLPDSVSEQRPENQLVITVGAEDIVVQGRPVARIAELQDVSDPSIEGLATELAYHAERKGAVPEGGFDVTIMGDRTVPYWLLKKIMYTCQSEDFAQVSLAVNRVGDTAIADVGEGSPGGAS